MKRGLINEYSRVEAIASISSLKGQKATCPVKKQGAVLSCFGNNIELMTVFTTL